MTSTSARTRAVPNPGPTLPPEVSLAEYAASTVDAPQPAWRTLNIARERAFTGELRFATAPAVTVFVDGGSVYFAERHGDAPLGERLMAAGVVTPQQLERGVVRVGGAEHLGRLFDRDPAVDRDAVMVVVESSTEALVAELAAEVVAAVEVNPYRHHQSGVHRWFVAPIDVSLSRPVSDVAQVDRSVIDDLPGLPAPTSAVRIEWDQPDVGGLAPPAPAQAPAPSAPEQPAADAAQREVVPAGPTVDPLADPGTGAAPIDDAQASTADVASAGTADEAEAWLDDFQIVWPDGSEELAAPAPRRVAPVMPTAAVDTVDEPATAAIEPVSVEPVAPEPVAPDDPPADANVSFAMPQLRIDTPPAPGADVPNDVADAVRRALQAIEQAATQPRPLPQIDLAPITLPELRLPTLGESTEPDAPQPMAEVATQPIASTPSTAAPHATTASPSIQAQPMHSAETVQPAKMASVVEPVATVPAAGLFAPPTADMSAESVYERLAAEQLAVEVAAVAAASEPTPEPGQASVVFLDEEDADASTRKGALRRLIGSLRRGD